jgi:hypothetical protein
MSDAVQESPAVAPSVGAPPADFAKWIGIDPADLQDAPEVEAEAPVETPEETAADDQPTDETPAEEPAQEEEATDEEPSAESEEDEKPKDAPKLPFVATAKGEAVDTTLLAEMTLTLKADGEEITLPLTDVVRRAQSEPAAQRKARQMESEAAKYERAARDYEAELAEVRQIALKMAKDPDYYATVVQDIEEYDAPEARAQRAEQALRSRDREQQEARAQAERQSRIQQFATERIAPTLSQVVEGSPLVSQEELLGRFMADTGKWTVNGVIPPEHFEDVAEYLRTDFARFAADRQRTYADREAKLKAETLKTQRERQAAKNERSAASKPVGTASALSAPAAPKRPTTFKDAEKGALDTLLAGLS